MRKIAITNHKGGCGKTTTAINLAASLAFLKKRALLIDLDPQGHSTCGLGIKAELLEKTAYDLFRDEPCEVRDLIVPVSDFLSLIPSYMVLSRAEQEWAAKPNATHCLLNQLSNIENQFDYVVLDLPPNLGVLTLNALTYADEAIIPIEPSFFSLHGLARIFETLDGLAKAKSKTFSIYALLTRFEKRTKLAREIKEDVSKHFKEGLLVTMIDESIRLREAAAAGKSIADFDRNSSGFRNYMALAIEMIERGLLRDSKFFLEPAVKERAPEIPSLTIAPPADFEVQETVAEQPAAEAEPSVIEKPLVAVSTEQNTAEQTTVVEEIKEVPFQEPPIFSGSLKPRKVLGGVLFSFFSKEAQTIMLAGDFNRWIAEPLLPVINREGLWQKVVPVEPGFHRYKFLINEEWKTDPFNDETAPNMHGGVDSVVIIDDYPPAYENREKTEARAC